MHIVQQCVQAWRVPHPPRRGVFVLGTQPKVHKGFHQAWQEVAQIVMASVKNVLDAAVVSREEFQMFVTGDSSYAPYLPTFPAH
jgi:hypothetical protein